MNVEILYFQGCPNHRPAIERITEILREERVSAEIAEIEAPDAATAEALRFLGSPTIRIDGEDVDPEVRSLTSFGIMCRTYTEAGTHAGIPSRALIRRAVHEALHRERRRSWLLGGSVIAALAASLCCILPIIAAGSGVAVLSFAAVFEPWRPLLVAAALILFGTGAILTWLGQRKACARGNLCATKPINRRNLLALGLLGVLVAALAAFPYYSGAGAAAVDQPASSGRTVGNATAGFDIAGMSCPACAAGLQATFRRLPGVTSAAVDYENRRATITYDPAKQTPEAFKQLVRQAGYQPR